MPSIVSPVLITFFVAVLSSPATAASESTTVAENYDLILGLACAFLALCVLVLLVALILPMVVFKKLGTANKDPDYVGSKYDLSPYEVGTYGSYYAQKVEKVYVPGNNGSDSAYATLSRANGEKRQGDDSNYSTIDPGNSTFKKAKPSGADATYDNPAYEDMNQGEDDYEQVPPTALAQYENPPVIKYAGKTNGAFENIELEVQTSSENSDNTEL